MRSFASLRVNRVFVVVQTRMISGGDRDVVIRAGVAGAQQALEKRLGVMAGE
jgi:type IV secretory pathway TrbD component